MKADGNSLFASGENASAEARRQAQRQWEANPCAAETVRGAEKESLAWFREARRVRYEEYAPWLRGATGIDKVSGSRVLEVGVGLGSDHYTLAQGGNEMHALDLSREHLRLCQRHLQLEGLTTKATHGDMERMPYPDNFFDVVYSFGVLHHTDHMPRAVSEIRRVLRPGGRAIISVYHRDSLFFWGQTVLLNGLKEGHFFKYGWRRTMARIEAGAGDEFVPTVRVLSRARLRALFADFSRQRMRTDHATLPCMLLKWQQRLSSEKRERWFSPWGWYLTIHATK